MDILDYAKKVEWHITVLSQGKRPHAFDSIAAAVECCKQLHDADKLCATVNNDDQKPAAVCNDDDTNIIGNGNQAHGDNHRANQQPSHRNGRCTRCDTCGKFHKGRCRLLDEQGDERPTKRSKSTQLKQQQEQTKAMMQMHAMMNNIAKKKKAHKKKKKQANNTSDSDDSLDMKHLLHKSFNMTNRNNSDSATAVTVIAAKTML